MRFLGQSFFLILACQFLAWANVLRAQESNIIRLDTVIDWTAPFKKEVQENLAKQLSSITAKDTEAYRQKKEAQLDIHEYFLANAGASGSKVVFFDEALQVQKVQLRQLGEDVAEITVEFKAQDNATNALGTIEQKLVEKLGPPLEKPILVKFGNGNSGYYKRWKNENIDAIAVPIPNGNFVVALRNLKSALTVQRMENPQMNVDLDHLLNLASLWNFTVGDFEKIYRPRVTAEDETTLEKAAQFEWLNQEKSRARFSQKMSSPFPIRLTMFAKSMQVEEAVVEFVNGRVSRITISFYNRGDSGEIKLADFEETFKSVGKNVGQVFKTVPRNMSASVSSSIKTVSWMWQSPNGIAMLEHNDYANSVNKGHKPEFLRLKLAAPGQADWSMGKLTVGIQRMALLKNVIKAANGDVYISGVPMVDQGAKGYCVAASCQRMFEYMQIPCDQHEIAQIVSADAESGANIFEMQKSLAKVDQRFKVSFKPFINPELYYSAAGKRRVSVKQFSTIVKEHVDKGIPLLWALELGRFPENPPLPNDGQLSGGHMRMVIGYNSAKNEIIFTDSWGAGHELKRMSEAAGYEVTLGLYSMSPAGM